MSFRDLVQKEVDTFKNFAEEANLQAHLKKSEVSAQLRTAWMEAEQNLAKLEAKVDTLGEKADNAAEELMAELKRKREELLKLLDD